MRCNSKFPSKPPQNFELKRVVERLIARCTSPFCSVRPPAYPSVPFNVRECTHALTCFVHIQLRFYACAHSDKSAVANVQHAHTHNFTHTFCYRCLCWLLLWTGTLGECARARAHTHTHTHSGRGRWESLSSCTSRDVTRLKCLALKPAAPGRVDTVCVVCVVCVCVYV